jgi:hypothetical protein
MLKQIELKNFVEILDNYIDIEILEDNITSKKIYLKDYGFTYHLKFLDWYLLEALRIIFNCEINHASKYTFTSEDIKIFSASDLIDLRNAIREDHKYFNGLYKKYFYKAPDFEILKDKVDKEYVLDYIKVINSSI